jgi:23S rRNA (guanosine2251-2'-O)-methyltransferase
MWNMMKLYLILHNIRSVENVGSIFRTADCAGVEKIYISGYTPAPIDRFGRKRKDMAKVSLGAEESVAFEMADDINKLINKLKRKKVKIAALEQDSNSIDYKKAGMILKKDDLALILGNEIRGIEKNILKKSDLVIEIPQRGIKESLNVSVAAGIAIFRLLDI